MEFEIGAINIGNDGCLVNIVYCIILIINYMCGYLFFLLGMGLQK